jgi:hypothetical protein
MGYNSIAWLPLTVGLTAIGMIASCYAISTAGCARRCSGSPGPGKAPDLRPT